jgi:hypothetical protein
MQQRSLKSYYVKQQKNLSSRNSLHKLLGDSGIPSEFEISSLCDVR